MKNNQETKESARFGLTEAQYARFRELASTPAATWPETLQRRVLAAIEREGELMGRRNAVEWAIAAYVRKAVPKTTRPPSA
ncbi:MAG TPA: hypothetical protein VGS80_21195 [Ktedonobacterales bacterium]|nr:hypothetical protein [Ktedonobacterales bacterium]